MSAAARSRRIVVAGVAIVVLGGLAGACSGTSSTITVDARLTLPPDAASAIDAPGTVDGSPPLSWVDFVVSGCGSYDPTGPVCSGLAPLELRFAAIAPAPIDTLVWSFGDGTAESTTRSPSHVFVLPGAYSVELTVGGAAGSTAQTEKMMFVEVTPQPLGAACGVDAQCAPGLNCLCGSGQTCPTTLSQGVCTEACSAGSACGLGAVCANLGPAGNPQSSAWQKTLCLPGCQADTDCSGGFLCRELRDGGGGSGWVQACFAPDLVVDDGLACDSPNGTPDPTRCASGSCLALGARGLCATPCASETCPSYGTCATFSNGVKACLARCTTDHPCESDPWLACEAPVTSGTYGFSVAESPVEYCAPRRCEEQDQCGTDGVCTQEGGAGFCSGQ